MFKSVQNTNKWLSRIQFFFLGCVMGWIWEVALYWATHRTQKSLLIVITELRGFLHGPWVPIYGVGCIIMLLLRERFPKKPILFFLSGMAASGVLEFATSWFLEKIFHARWWDYSDQFMNLDGRICLSALLFFGFAGLLVVYLLEPVFQTWMLKIPLKVRRAICLTFSLLFVADILYSSIAPNLGIGVWVL